MYSLAGLSPRQVAGTENLVRQSLAAGVKQFIFISSIGAVTTLSDRTITEKTPPQPDTPYGSSKLAAEQALITMAQNTNLHWTIFRPSLVYGKGNPGNMGSLIKLIKLRIPLPFGAINNRRSFLYVGNLVDAIAISLHHPQAANQTFLISDREPLSTPELIKLIAKALNFPVTLIPFPLSLLKKLAKIGDVVSKVLGKSFPLNSNTISKLSGSLAVDSSHICNSLNWQQPYTTQKGLRKGL